MKILYTKSKWEMWNDPLETFLKRAASDGFDAVEVFLPALSESASEIRDLLATYDLQLVAQIISEGGSPEEHKECLCERVDFAAETKPLFINCHSGRDIFSFEDNCAVIESGDLRAKSHGLTLTHETHRGRPTFNGPDTVRYLEWLPEMKLNADFSHWFCAHESDLSDQPENVERAIRRSWHIHARVGFEEGPQVAHPLVPEWMNTTEKFVALWSRILEARKRDGAHFFTITPEFGPPPYMPCEPNTKRPMADAWEVNVEFMKYLKNQFGDKV